MEQLYDVDAERSVLGAIIIKPDIAYEVMDKLRADDFYRQQHRLVFLTLAAMIQKKVPVDIVSITEQLKETGRLDKVGGIPFITQLANVTPTAANVMHHADIVLQYSKRRQMMAVAEELRAAAMNLEGEPGIDDVQEKLSKISMHDDHDVMDMMEQMLAFTEWMNERRERAGAGVMSGFASLDLITHGWHDESMHILAARPSMGKTALALNFAANAAKKGKHVAFFSLEMSKEQVEARLIAAESGVSSDKIMNPYLLKDDDWAPILKAQDAISKWPMYIIDSGAGTPHELAAKARQVKGKYGLDMIIVDYLQLMSGDGRKASENRTQEVSYISRRLKVLAKELKVPILALSQLSRSVENRNDKRPILSDLRESGAIEQDADVIMFLYREDYYYPERNTGVTELDIKKNRNGAIGKVYLKFVAPLTRFALAPNQNYGEHVPSSSIPM